MLFTGWYQADSLISIMIGLLIFYSSGKLILASLNVLLEGVPSHTDVEALERKLAEQKGVKSTTTSTYGASLPPRPAP